MRIGFSVDLAAEPGHAGRYKFIHRLAAAMQRGGVQIDNNRPDVHLYLPSHKPNRRAAVNVLRLDGLYPGRGWRDWRENRMIKRAIRRADAVVFQGEFCRQAYQRFLKIDPQPATCIHNGADPGGYLPRNVERFFLANANWRPHKRPGAITQAFILASQQGLDADLVITAEPPQRLEHPRIRYIGWQDESQLRQLLATTMASIHAAWIDWCPNAMVEAIVAGCPVIYTTNGGQGELGTGAGWAIDDAPWDFRPCDLSRPPQPDIDAMAAAMLEAARQPRTIHRPDLHIDRIAGQYLTFFEQLLSKR